MIKVIALIALLSLSNLVTAQESADASSTAEQGPQVTIESLRDRIRELERERDELLLSYVEEYPPIQRIQRDIAALREQMEALIDVDSTEDSETGIEGESSVE